MEKKKKSAEINNSQRISSNIKNERNNSQNKIKISTSNIRKKSNRSKGNNPYNTLLNLPPIKSHSTRKTSPAFVNSYDIQNGNSSEKESLELQLYYTKNEMEKKNE